MLSLCLFDALNSSLLCYCLFCTVTITVYIYVVVVSVSNKRFFIFISFSSFRYSDRLEPTKKTGSKKGMWAGIGSGIMWFIIYATYALAFWYGVGLIIDSRHETYPVYTPAVLMIVSLSDYLQITKKLPEQKEPLE